MKTLRLRVTQLLFALIGLILLSGAQSQRAYANPGPFQTGDIFASVSDSKIQHYNAAGALIETLDTGQGLSLASGSNPVLRKSNAPSSGANTTGCAFDSIGNLYVTTFNTGGVIRFAGLWRSPHEFGCLWEWV